MFLMKKLRILSDNNTLQRLDIGVVGFGTSHTREKVVNFGISFYPGGVRMASSKSITKKDQFFFLKPFSAGVW